MPAPVALGIIETLFLAMLVRIYTALAVARRARVAEHALRRNRPSRHTQDDLLYPPTAPAAF